VAGVIVFIVTCFFVPKDLKAMEARMKSVVADGA